MENAIKVTGLSKHYSGFELSDVSFTLPRGSVMGFIGRKGAGKTTTIKLIIGQRTKLSIAIAVSHHAEILVMEEPTSGLDPVFRSELIYALYRVIQDERKSIFFSDHITDSASQWLSAFSLSLKDGLE